MGARPRLKEQFRPPAARRRPGPARPKPGVGVVLDGLDDDEVELLERLDGSLDEAAADAAWRPGAAYRPSGWPPCWPRCAHHALTVDSPAHRLDLPALPGPSGQP